MKDLKDSRVLALQGIQPVGSDICNEGKTLSQIAKIRSRSLSNSALSQGESIARCTLAPWGRGKIFLANAVSLENWVRGQLFAQQTETDLSHKRSFASLKMTSVGHSEQREESHKLDCFTPSHKTILNRFVRQSVRNDETTLVPQYLSALVPFKKAAFTLAEMMVVMLIASIILACMAPAITTRIKMDQTSTQNLSPWKWAENAIDAYFSNDNDASAMIGQNEKADTDSAKLIINNSTGLDDLIFFKNNDNINGHLRIDENELYLGTPVYGGNSVSVGTDIVPLGTPNLDAVSIGHNIQPARRSVFIGSGIKNTAGGTTSDSGMNSVAIGVDALGHVSDGYDNIAIGSDSLSQTTTGWGNVAVGVGALRSNTVGNNNVAIGGNALLNTSLVSNNIAIGTGALENQGYILSSTPNIAIGYNSMNSNTTGNSNQAVGYYSLYRNTTGSANSAFGHSSMFSNTTGSDNTAFGYLSMHNNTTGSYNTAIGASALPANTTGQYNTALGYRALQNSVDAQNNTAIGYMALSRNNADGNTAVGYMALSNSNADYNTAVGAGALSSITDGFKNVAIGSMAMEKNINGEKNVAVGHGALQSDEASDSNTAIGFMALNENTNNENTAVGEYALQFNTSGAYNTAVGVQALQLNKTGNDNTAVGELALYYAKGNGNTALGERACKNIKGSNKTCIGAGSGPASTDTLAAADNEEKVIFLGDADTTVYIPGNLIVGKITYLGYNYDKTPNLNHNWYDDNETGVFMNIGSRGDTNSAFGALVDTSASDAHLRLIDPDYGKSSDRRLKNVGKENIDGLAKIRKLRIFNYTYKKDDKKIQHVGVIAQDLQKIFPNAVKKGADGFLRIRMEDMFYAVINAIKELDAKYQAQEKRINELEKRIEKLEAKIK